jgi:hypothetical protein
MTADTLPGRAHGPVVEWLAGEPVEYFSWIDATGTSIVRWYGDLGRLELVSSSVAHQPGQEERNEGGARPAPELVGDAGLRAKLSLRRHARAAAHAAKRRGTGG